MVISSFDDTNTKEENIITIFTGGMGVVVLGNAASSHEKIEKRRYNMIAAAWKIFQSRLKVRK